MSSKIKIAAVLFVIIVIGVVIAGRQHDKSSATAQPSAQAAHAANAQTTPTSKQSSFDKKQYSIDDPTSIWVIVNKKRPLNPQDYIPADLVIPNLPQRVPGNESMQMRKVTADALSKMFAASSADGVPMMISSGYRSYSYQVALYNKYVKDEGQAVADTQSARPGHSEHQTGLAVDVEPKDQKCDVDQCFADTPAGKWITANAYKYGFVIRYPLGKDSVTGYEYEPWHVRYVGISLATEMHIEGVSTLEEFFGLPAAPDY